MKRYIWFIFCPAFFAADIQAQETVHWASHVVEASSEVSHLEYSALQVLHKPNVIPAHGDNPNAWTPAKDTKEQFIVVYFDKPFQAQQVAIAESQNPGSVKRIFAYDTNQEEHLLFEIEPRNLPIESRLLNLFFEKTTYQIEALRVELDVAAVNGVQSIDAIGISNSNIPISVLINVAPLVNENLDTEKLDDNVNSQYIEHSPILSPDGKRLYFSRRGHPDNQGGAEDPADIWFSELDESVGEWLPAKNIGPPLNNSGPNFISAIIPDGEEQIILLGNRYRSKGRMFSGVSLARISSDGSISTPENISIKNDYNYSPKADYYPTTDQKVLLMSVERDDTYGNRDLYVSFKKGEEWSEPLSLGGDVNTAADEASPYLQEDNKTLFFSSSGFSGFGGSDIYKTSRLDNSWTKWTEPENMGGGLNSTGDDVYFNMPATSKHAYFTRGNSDENTDIFRFTVDDFYIDTLKTDMESKPLIATVSGKVLNTKNNQPVVGALIVIDEEGSGADIADLTSDRSGNYQVELKPGISYGFVAIKDGYEGKKEVVDVVAGDESNELDKDLYLDPVALASPLEIVYFDYNKSDVKSGHQSYLNGLVKFFESGGIDVLQLDGHTDSKGSEYFNLKLSESRANEVMDYLVSKGIATERIKVVPKGELEPAAPNDNDENKAKNRRVELKLVDANAN